MQPNGSSPWDLDRLSATGRHFLLEPDSRSGIVRELQQRLQREQQKRYEHQLLLRSSNNAGERQPDEKEQQDEQQSDIRESDEALQSLETGTRKKMTTAPLQPVAPPPPPPPPPPRPAPKNQDSGSLRLPTQQIQEVNAQSNLTLAGNETATKAQSSRRPSQDLLQNVKVEQSKLLADEEAVTKSASQNSGMPRLPSQPMFGGESATKAKDQSSRSELFEEVKVRQSKLSWDQAAMPSQDSAPRLSARVILEEAKTQHKRKSLDGENKPTRRASGGQQTPANNVRPPRQTRASAGLDGEHRPAARSVEAEKSLQQPKPEHYAAGSSGVSHGGSIKQWDSLRDASLDAASANAGFAEYDFTRDQSGSAYRLGSTRQAEPSDSTSGPHRLRKDRDASPAGEPGEADVWNRAVSQKGNSLRLADSPIKVMAASSTIMDDFQHTAGTITQQGSLRSASSATSPCLMCLMRCLQDSGLMGSCWNAAILELEEAFAIKAVADAAVAGAGETTPSQRSQQLYQQPYKEQHYQQQSQLQGFGLLPTAPQQPSVANASKWHALERLCSLRNSFRTCSHSSD